MGVDFSCLDGMQREVAERLIERESAQRHHLVVALSGSHAYGFPSPDSDLDLKAIHVADTDRLLGLGSSDPTANRLEIIDGVEIDYTSNELGAVLKGILAGNGNYIERVLGPLLVYTTPELAELAPLVRGALSRKVHHHYHGFAHSQRKAVAEADAPTAKKLLYVFRTALTGVHLLMTGELVTDVTVTARAHGVVGIDELLAIKQAGERTALAPTDADAWKSRMTQAFELLDDARRRSVLPAEPANVAELDAWLVALRRRR
ncbi:MAG TPA: nucleotidyltransferase domain-containing protein [Kofleriaceae bacterium]|nr:nucleotidyltransferase domain-containing protein [Kofleriaceae bacterium]